MADNEIPEVFAVPMRCLCTIYDVRGMERETVVMKFARVPNVREEVEGPDHRVYQVQDVRLLSILLPFFADLTVAKLKLWEV